MAGVLPCSVMDKTSTAAATRCVRRIDGRPRGWLRGPVNLDRDAITSVDVPTAAGRNVGCALPVARVVGVWAGIGDLGWVGVRRVPAATDPDCWGRTRVQVGYR